MQRDVYLLFMVADWKSIGSDVATVVLLWFCCDRFFFFNEELFGLC